MTSPASPHLLTGEASVSLRHARPADASALAALAAMDEVAVREPVLVAAHDGRVVAALSLADGAVAADPFARTADTVALLRLRALQERGSGAARRRFLGLRRLPARPLAG